MAASAAVAASLQAVTVSAEALHLDCSWPQMKPEMTLMLRALPWLKSAESAGAKDSSLRPSRPAANSMAGLLQDPKSSWAWRARSLRSFLALAAALHSSSVVKMGVSKISLSGYC